jgi:hypothetical protein
MKINKKWGLDPIFYFDGGVGGIGVLLPFGFPHPHPFLARFILFVFFSDVIYINKYFIFNNKILYLIMFKKKYNISIIDSKWNVIKRNLELGFIPRNDEFIFYDDTYYKVLNVIHRVNSTQEIFIVVEKLENEFKLIDSE